jgi:hypothetical protein
LVGKHKGKIALGITRGREKDNIKIGIRKQGVCRARGIVWGRGIAQPSWAAVSKGQQYRYKLTF